MKNVLVTGGAGFIGTHLCEKLYDLNYKVIVYDSLSSQVHGEGADIPSYLRDKVEFINGNVIDRDKLMNVVKRVDKVIHLASETGVGQSMYEVERYSNGIIQGTSILWDILANEEHGVKKVVLSSSRAVYGEGKYSCENCGIVYPDSRDKQRLEKGDWELYCPNCNEGLTQCATDERALLKPTSIYAIGKKTQEEISMVMGRALNIPVSVVRYQNVYGPRQSLSNPYTGILSIFTARLKSGKPINVYEDGLESRDFVHVSDAVDGTILCLENEVADYEVFNIANGVKTTVMEVANILTEYLNPNLTPVVTGNYRLGDIRHCYADITKAKELLGYYPKFDIGTGIKSFLDWSEKESFQDLSDKAERELIAKGMLEQCSAN
ncbi:nucleoside-diphosphate-sugar epimerase [Cohnella xylanilytica]|uniref:SDR family NAD(P)-dependent oxidoreductase n=1 Tax=Cohnella xylanilytica TaxID=557555 RepID=UPI001B09CF75|nr:SDR family NAD(P)-dependent oxidoreductase [Cohnella xylanilytica]GIO12250.1 nucleoside-diphosphate-sugar epimerase [Cohnella xylanilytica]